MGLRQILSLVCLLGIHSILSVSASLETYIVRVQSPGEFEHITQLPSTSSTGSNTREEDLDRWYHSFLPSTTASSSHTEESRMVHGYHNVFTGFSAELSPEHVKAMENMPGFVSARPVEVLSLHTTHSPNFLGLHQNTGLWEKSNYGKGIIIGVLDSGIAPDHPSFSGEGVPPPPSKWKGRCDFEASLCNNKVIGARDLSRGGSGSPTDENGHGSHVASIVAGNFVRDANVFGNANGTAVGIAPLAHLAIYQVCQSNLSCYEDDILKGIDVAVGDGVDILSMSLGESVKPYYASAISMATYRAVQKGIFVSGAGGNGGPSLSTLINVAPWVLTVGASSIDRKIRVVAVLGNNVELLGESVFEPANFSSRQFALFYPGLNQNDPRANRNCSEKLSEIAEVKGKIIVCEYFPLIVNTMQQGINVRNAGGVGMILINPASEGYTIRAETPRFPSTHLTYADRLRLISYMNSTASPTVAMSFKGTLIGDSLAPEVASFSSRGPNILSPGILKPDILGPGVSILAAWPFSLENNPNMKANFYIISGTSMSCPHLSGVAALLKSAHPDWSPAAIKSAMMTSADVVNRANNPILNEQRRNADLFATGSGHVNPTRADNPGLIYDIEPKDYISYLCGLNYTDEQLSKFLQQRAKCTTKIPESQLNYPSFVIQVGERVQKYTRTVTNVGEAGSVYRVNVESPTSVKVAVKPSQLSFSKVNQKLTYEVTFDVSKLRPNTFSQGSITWISRTHSVRVPIMALYQSSLSLFSVKTR